MAKSTWRAVIWQSGRNEMLTRPGCISKPSREQRMLEAMLPCVSWRPSKCRWCPRCRRWWQDRREKWSGRAFRSVGPRMSGAVASDAHQSVTQRPAKGARSPANSIESMTMMRSIFVCGRMERILCNCWSEERKITRQPESFSTKAVCSGSERGIERNGDGAERSVAISAIGHSGRFSLRRAMRSPG